MVCSAVFSLSDRDLTFSNVLCSLFPVTRCDVDRHFEFETISAIIITSRKHTTISNSLLALAAKSFLCGAIL